MRLFAEMMCITSPTPDLPFISNGPRIHLVGRPIDSLQYSATGEESQESSPYPRLRELEMIQKFPDYEIRVGLGRHFISFKNARLHDPLGYYEYAKDEVARINRVLNSLLPEAAEICLSRTLFQAESDTSLRPVWEKDVPICETAKIVVVEEKSVFCDWNAYIKEICKSEGRKVSRLLELERSNPTVGACVALTSQNTFPSFYMAWEIIAREFGGQAEVIKSGRVMRKNLSDFTENAQITRHSNKRLGVNTRPMGLPEAKMFVIKLLEAYIQHRVS